jgi:predicted amidohydrolase YtcJ
MMRFASMLWALLLVPCALAQTQNVDLVIINGKVLTLDDDFSIRSAVAIQDSKIVAVGGPDIARKYRAARTLDLKGRVLLPGFMDTHVHIIPRANAIWT